MTAFRRERNGPHTGQLHRAEIERLAHAFFDGTGPTYDRVAVLCTWGADIWWKRRIMKRLPPGVSSVLDQACGTGILAIMIARRFPGCRVTGVDMTNGYLEVTRQKAARLGLSNLRFIAGRAEDVTLNERFDCITSSYLPKYADLRALVTGARHMLREGGTIVMHDFTFPGVALFASVWRLHFLLLRSVAARIYPEWKPAFDDLPALIRTSTWVPDLCALFARQGFIDIDVEHLTFGSAAIVSATRGAIRPR
jgi:demethylmenaquinone methyltransferase/2-methoxy-6-polyprenyl-1,4-benzoquinol methylase